MFLILIGLIALNYWGFTNTDIWIIVGVGFVWLITIYVKIHLRNRDKKRPQAVYLAK